MRNKGKIIKGLLTDTIRERERERERFCQESEYVLVNLGRGISFSQEKGNEKAVRLGSGSHALHTKMKT